MSGYFKNFDKALMRKGTIWLQSMHGFGIRLRIV